MVDKHYQELLKKAKRNYTDAFNGAIKAFKKWLEDNGHKDLSQEEQKKIAKESGIDLARWSKYKNMAKKVLDDITPRNILGQMEVLDGILNAFWKEVKDDLKVSKEDINTALCEVLEAWIQKKQD